MNRKLAMRHQQGGFTIVELMVAGTLGLILIVGVLQVFISSRQTYRVQDAISSVQDGGRFALQFLSEDIQKAGWSNSADALSQRFVFNNTASRDDCTAVATDVSSDCIQLRYEGATDCLGASTAGTGGVATDTFQITNVTTSTDDGVKTGELSCTSNGQTQALISNVESFQIMYGVDTDGDRVPNQYVNAAGVGNNQQLIMAVKIALVVVSDANALDAVRNYAASDTTVLDQAGYVRSDRRLRRIYQMTVAVPNRPISTL